MCSSSSAICRIDRGEFKNSDFDDQRQPEIVIWLPKPEVLISPKVMIDIVNISTANLDFQPQREEIVSRPLHQPPETATAGETGNTHNIAETIRDSIELPTANREVYDHAEIEFEQPGHSHYCRACRGRIPQICRRHFDLTAVVLGMKLFPVLADKLPLSL